MKNDEPPGGEAKGLLARLLERHVVQSAALYVAVAWGAVEILLTLQERLGWPEWLATTALALFVAGFPLVLVWSWYRDLQSRAARVLVVVGAVALAGIAFWLTLGSEPERERHPAPSFEAVATVAVLDFENLTGNDSLDYLVTGFTGELIARLSKHPDLAVIQRDSLESPLLANLIPVAQAAALSADYFVTGGIRREDKFLEINARLQDADGQVLWSEVAREPYGADAVAGIQRRISGEVSRVIGTRLGAPEFCGESSELEAMEFYYQGRRRVLQRGRENLEAGVGILKQAVDRDPYYGRAWNVLGEAYLVLPGAIHQEGDPAEAEAAQATMQPLAMAAFRRALEICPTLGFAYKVTVPAYEGVENGWIGQEMEWRDALAMDPNDGGLLKQYAIQLQRTGRMEAAAEVTRRAMANDPLMASVVFEHAWSLLMAGRCDEAIPLSRRAEELGGDPMRWIEMNCAEQAEDEAGLLEVFRHQDRVTGGLMRWLGFEDLTIEEFVEAWFHPESPVRDRLWQAVEAQWTADPTRRNPMRYVVVGIGIHLGEIDFVFGILEQLSEGDLGVGLDMSRGPIWKLSPAHAAFRSDRRFAALMEQIGLVEYWETYGWADRCRPEGASFACS